MSSMLRVGSYPVAADRVEDLDDCAVELF